MKKELIKSNTEIEIKIKLTELQSNWILSALGYMAYLWRNDKEMYLNVLKLKAQFSTIHDKIFKKAVELAKKS